MPSTDYTVGGSPLPRPFRVQRLGHIGLTHHDLSGARAFYDEALGFREADVIASPDGSPVALFTSIGTDHHTLVHVDAAMEAKKDGLDRGVSVNQISFQVGTLREVADANTYFVNEDIPTWRYGRDFPGSNWAVYAYDPDGFRVELYYGMEQIGWDRQSKPVQFYQRGYVPTLPEPSEYSESRVVEADHPDLKPGFRPAEGNTATHDVGGIMLPRPFSLNKIGPVHLFVDDVEASEAFYVDRIGLVRTEEVVMRGHSVRFLRHGTDHHSVGLFPLALRAELGFDARTRLMALGVELGSYQQLLDAVTWLREGGRTVLTDLPQALRAGIDHAAFVTDPGGHAVMLYCGIEQIGWDGRPRPVADRRVVPKDWSATYEPFGDTHMSLLRQGPMA